MKIDWNNVWDTFETWFRQPRRKFVSWPNEKKKIQSLVEAQLRRKKRGS